MRTPIRNKPRRTRKQVAVRLLVGGVGLYAAFLVFLFLAQRSLIFPGSVEAFAKPVIGSGARIVTLVTAGGKTISAEYAPATTSSGGPMSKIDPPPTALYFYGNGSSLSSSADVVDGLRRQGLNVIVPDYPGYGLSRGQASEADCYGAADAAYDYAARLGVEPRSLVIIGRSLGTGVAVDLASRRPAAGLVTVSAFTSIPDMASRQYPEVPYPIARALCRNPFNSELKIGRVACPILLIHGTADDYVPYSMSDRLARAATSPVTRLPVRGAGHNNIFSDYGAQVYPAIGAFARRLTAPPAQIHAARPATVPNRLTPAARPAIIP